MPLFASEPPTEQEQLQIVTIRPFFDAGFYQAQVPDLSGVEPVLHFIRIGWRNGHDPSRRFSSTGYLAANPDVAAAQVNPLLHYVQNGRAENRPLFPLEDTPAPITQAQIDQDIATLAPVFDAKFYLRSNPDVARAGLDPLEHFCQTGWREGRNPHPYFDVAKYLRKVTDLPKTGENPFCHYIRMHGQAALSQDPMQHADAPTSQKGLPELEASGYTSVALHQCFDGVHYRAQLPAERTPYDLVMDYVEHTADLSLDTGQFDGQTAHLETVPPRSSAADQGPLSTIFQDVETAKQRIRFGALLKECGTDNYALGRLDRMPWAQSIAWLADVKNALQDDGSHPLAAGLDDSDALEIAAEIQAPKDAESIRFGQLKQVESLLIWAAKKVQDLSPEMFDKFVHVEGFEHVQAALSSGRPVMIIGSHVGPGWCWLSVLTRLGVPILNVAAAPQPLAMADGYKHMTTSFPAAALAAAGKALKQQTHAVHMLPDDWQDHGETVPFLGRDHIYAQGFCYLAHKFQPVLLTVEGVLHDDGMLSIKIGKKLGEVPMGLPQSQNYSTLISRYNEWVETQWNADLGNVAPHHLRAFLNAPRCASSF